MTQYYGNKILVMIFLLKLICLLHFAVESATDASIPDTCPNAGLLSPSGYIDIKSDPIYQSKPFVDGAITFMNGKVEEWTREVDQVTSPMLNQDTGERIVIGKIPRMKETDALNVLESAKKAWNHGQGVWPQMKLTERIQVIENIIESLKEKRDEIINVLMWDICKNRVDAALEFDRTMEFIQGAINEFKLMDGGVWRNVRGVLARIRRAAIGIMLCLGPFNYPFNETYATLFPALLAGNVVIMKIPSVGGLVHMITAEVYAKHLPPGVLNFITGSGRTTMGPVMATGDIDILAFIGGSRAADALIKSHPAPHRLKVFLQLEGKNFGIVFPDADLNVAVDQISLGATSYNGQRCTAIKLVFVHRSIVDQFLPQFIKKISNLKVGLPFEDNVEITPLPEVDKPKYLQELIDDAVQNGASVVNSDCGGGRVSGSLFTPAILYPVTNKMRIWREEQFGPVIPVAVYDDIDEIIDIYASTTYGQQAAIFTSEASSSSSKLVDILSTVVGRININTQCGRSPDVYPFSGRRSSALGTMSISDAIREFSIETMVAGKYSEKNEQLMKSFENTSKFLSPL